jgi:hypothetical protein
VSITAIHFYSAEGFFKNTNCASFFLKGCSELDYKFINHFHFLHLGVEVMGTVSAQISNPSLIPQFQFEDGFDDSKTEIIPIKFGIDSTVYGHTIDFD